MSIEVEGRPRQTQTLRDRFDRFLSEVESWPFDLWEQLPVPVDIQETEERITLTATMPGIRAEDIEIDVQGGTVTIRGESREERDESDGTWHRRERKIGRVERKVTIPAVFDPGAAEANLRDGILTLTLPKQEPTPAHRIEVRET